MGAREDILSYLDQDGLIGELPHPTTKWTGGNELLDTGTAYLILKLLNQTTRADFSSYSKAVKGCEAGEPGIYNKEPGRPDQITHDDIIGVVTGSVALGATFQNDVLWYIKKNNWLDSNTGQDYWDATVKPWYLAFYTLAAGETPDVFSLLTLKAAILLDAFVGTDAGNKKLMWCIIKTIQRKSWIIDSAIKVWESRLKSGAYGSMKRVMTAYYGEKHPFAIYCPE